MNSKIVRRAGVLCSIVLGFFMVTGANAAAVTPINGTLELAGAWQPIDAGGSSTTIDLASGADFLGDAGVVVGTSGDFTAIPLFTVFTGMNDGQFVAPALAWSMPGYSFSLTSLLIESQNANSITMSGTGVLTPASGSGYDPTNAVWQFSGQTANNITYSWSSSVATVPVPAAIWLMLSGIGALGVAGRKKRA